MYSPLNLAVLATALVATPVVAAEVVRYEGTVRGIITSGTASYQMYVDAGPEEDPNPIVYIDLTGKPITIDFSAKIIANSFNEIDGLYTKIVNAVSVMIPIPSPLDHYFSDQTNDSEYNLATRNYGTVDFAGTANDGFFYISGALGDADFKQRVMLNFADASSTDGPLSGSGTTSAYFFNQRATYQYSDVMFTLANGFVTGSDTVSPVPEPATWAMMIAGFGLVGATMRQRRTVVTAASRHIATSYS